MAYSTISKPGLYFNTKLFEGNGSTQSLTGVGFQPDWVWFKNRDSSQNHRLFDAVRGAGKNIKSNGDTAEIDAGTGASGQLRTFDSDGFSVGSDGSVNNNNESIVAWNWKAGTTGSGTTGGSGTGKSYSYSVNTTAGFSIVKYGGNGTAGHTIPHHLGAIPRFIMVKATTRQDNWRLYHAGISDSDPETDEIYLDVTNAAVDTNTAWYDTAPTSSVFTVGTNNGVNKNLSVPSATYLLPSLSTKACCFLTTPTIVSVVSEAQPPTFSGRPYLNLTLSESTQRFSAPASVSCLSIPGLKFNSMRATCKLLYFIFVYPTSSCINID